MLGYFFPYILINNKYCLFFSFSNSNYSIQTKRLTMKSSVDALGLHWFSEITFLSHWLNERRRAVMLKIIRLIRLKLKFEWICQVWSINKPHIYQFFE